MVSIVTDLMAEALFASDLQPSSAPSPQAVHEAVTATLLRHGADGCAAILASEYGDHPESAVARMCWARAQAAATAATITGADLPLT